jgi:hypothetical protein
MTAIDWCIVGWRRTRIVRWNMLLVADAIKDCERKEQCLGNLSKTKR